MARAVFARVSSTDPFQPRLGARLLLYPIDYTLLDAAQFEAVATASIHAGVERLYFAGYGGEALPEIRFEPASIASVKQLLE